MQSASNAYMGRGAGPVIGNAEWLAHPRGDHRALQPELTVRALAR